MYYSSVVLAICWTIATARPSGHWSDGHLEGVPNLEGFGKIMYPTFNVLELGSFSKDEIPPKEIQITKHITIKEPQPYPVKVPHPIPVPVPHKVPYPIIQTKIVKVPQTVPVEIIKKVPVPIEVPKPYPVPSDEYKPPNHQAEISNYGGSGQGGHLEFNGGGFDHAGSYQQLTPTYGVPGQAPGQPLGHQEQDGGYENNGGGYQESGGYGEADQSVGHAALAQLQQRWSPAEEPEQSQQQGEQENSKGNE